MSKRTLIKLIPLALLWGGLSLWSILSPSKAYSDTERRPLMSAPSLSAQAIASGSFASDFETYSLDQFPMRDSFRALKSFVSLQVLDQKQVNDLYLRKDYIVKAEYPLHQNMITHAADRFNYIYDTYLANTNAKVYLCVIPDKNYFLAEESGQLSMDYTALVETLTEQTPNMEYLDIFPALTIDDYYRTDTHWKQESLLPCANILLAGMREEDSFRALSEDDYTLNTIDAPFYGVYYGQLGLPVSPDSLSYLTSDSIDHCVVTSYNTGKPVTKSMYDTSKIDSKDPYELFVCGSDALVTIESPLACSNRELIVFRDSFASSIAPLFVDNYAKITLVDIRYISPDMLEQFISFSGGDVLFLYSTLVLNSSTSFK